MQRGEEVELKIWGQENKTFISSISTHISVILVQANLATGFLLSKQYKCYLTRINCVLTASSMSILLERVSSESSMAVAVVNYQEELLKKIRNKCVPSGLESPQILEIRDLCMPLLSFGGSLQTPHNVWPQLSDGATVIKPCCCLTFMRESTS